MAEVVMVMVDMAEDMATKVVMVVVDTVVVQDMAIKVDMQAEVTLKVL